MSVRPIGVVLAVLVLDDVLLNPELGVVERSQQICHPIRLHGDGAFDVGRGKVDEIVGPVR